MDVYLSLGSNLGDRSKAIESALNILAEHLRIQLVSVSRIQETLPYGYHLQPLFLNCAAYIKTDKSADNLLKTIHSIEDSLGRTRKIRWGPRTIDIDILFYGNRIIETENLLVPHPGIRNRLFVLESLMELCPDLIHPLLKRTIKDIYYLKTC